MATLFPTAPRALPLVVIIPTHNRLSLLERTIDSVFACTAPVNRDVRLIVIENGGKFGVEVLLLRKRGWIPVEYHYFPSPNKSSALNSCLDTLENAVVLFLDDDVRVDPRILIEYSNATRDSSGGQFFGGGMLVDYEEPPPPWLLEHLPFSAKGWHPDSDAYSGVCGGLDFMGCNWAAFSSDIWKAGGFNPRLGPGGTSGGTGQERAMQIALRDGGCTPKYIREAVVWHYVPKSRCSVGWTLRRSYRNAISWAHERPIPRGQRTYFGVPKRLIRRAIKEALEVVRSWRRDDPASRFRKMNSLFVTCGLINGSRARR